jgi:hypothetical protein
MIIESEAVGPIFKNGFVVGCEETREAVLIDPGDEVATLLASAERLKLTIRRILLTHAHVDHVTGVAAAKRALGVRSICTATISFTTMRSGGAMFGLKVEPQPPIDPYYALDEVTPSAATSPAASHAGHCPGACACRSAGKAKPERSCSSAIRSLPDRSGGPTCRAAISTC